MLANFKIINNYIDSKLLFNTIQVRFFIFAKNFSKFNKSLKNNNFESITAKEVWYAKNDAKLCGNTYSNFFNMQ